MHLLVMLLKELFLVTSFEWTSLKDAYLLARRISKAPLKTRRHITVSKDQGAPLKSNKCYLVAWVWDDSRVD